MVMDYSTNKSEFTQEGNKTDYRSADEESSSLPNSEDAANNNDNDSIRIAESSMINESSSSLARELTEEENEIIEKQQPASEFKKKNLEEMARKNWDKFYRRNEDKFFKDRNWTKFEFLAALPEDYDIKKNRIFLEVGCGVGNMLFPLMRLYNHWTFYAFDFSQNAINILNERKKDFGYCNSEIFVADLTEKNFSFTLPKAHLASLIFVISSIGIEKHELAIRNLVKCLAKGAFVIVRDYGINDEAMLRFGRGCKLSERFYARQDGTRTFYFQLEELDRLFISNGFIKYQSAYHFKKCVNRKMVSGMNRVFVHATYINNND